ncbi:MAG TPA: glycosyltransferase family 1 protein, partial [Tepidisphaeraceae bacterium]|nr:glycosyltransferase family 1 protein [Tepidisphaeraceae bacterium]
SFIEKFNIDPAKIEVIPNAPQAELVNIPGDGIWTRQALPDRFLFYPANTYRHKNHALLLDAIEQLNAAGVKMPVVFSGFELPGGFPLRKEIARRGLDGQCQVFTDLPPQELRYLFRHALAVVMPTRFEGFGMPAIEAAACGCPLICSDLPVLREILDDNALYFSPDSVDEACAQIRRVMDDPSLREGLIERGFDIAERYTWDRSATRMLQVFKEARERFVWSRHAPHTVKRPRIGILLRMNGHGGAGLVPTVESILCTGYPDLVTQCEVPADVPAHTRQFLRSAGVRMIDAPKPSSNGNGDAHHRDGYDRLERFAREHNADLVTELFEGNRFKISGLDSAAWAYLEAPDKPVQLGEAMAWRGPQFVDIARFRLTGDGLWKLEGFLFTEMMFIAPAAMDAWTEGKQAIRDAGAEWRWELLRAAHSADRLFLTRRTLGDCDQHAVTAYAQAVASYAGINQYHTVATNQVARVRLLRYVEPGIKRAASVLPRKWQDAGTRLWYHLSR